MLQLTQLYMTHSHNLTWVEWLDADTFVSADTGGHIHTHTFDLARYCTALYCTVLYCTVLYCTVLYCTVLYCTVLYCTALYCTVLYRTCMTARM